MNLRERLRPKPLDPELHGLVAHAERAVRAAQQAALDQEAPWPVVYALGRAQSILMSIVAGRHPR